MAHISVQFPFAADLADVWSSTVSMAARDSGLSPVTTTDHGLRHWDSDSRKILFVADVVADDVHLGLLQVAVHTARVTDLSPTSDVALVSWLQVCRWQTYGLHIFVHHHRFRQLEERNVIVKSSES
jgi:hypothetical protein